MLKRTMNNGSSYALDQNPYWSGYDNKINALNRNHYLKGVNSGHGNRKGNNRSGRTQLQNHKANYKRLDKARNKENK